MNKRSVIEAHGLPTDGCEVICVKDETPMYRLYPAVLSFRIQSPYNSDFIYSLSPDRALGRFRGWGSRCRGVFDVSALALLLHCRFVVGILV